jgi:site-specific recombinase XerD
MAKQTTMMGPWVRRFLIEHLIGERNLAHNTQRSYRDTFCQLLPFITKDAGEAIDHLVVDDLSPEMVRRFLAHIEGQRHCGARTRNQRLAAIHAFARFVAERSPEHIAWCTGLRAVPFKRFDRAALCYLDKPEIDALIAAPDCSCSIGRRDHALLLFLYNTGAKASEVASVTIGDIESRPDGTGSVRLVGKGAKTRYCPLWPTTLTKVMALTGKRALTEKLFINQRGQPLTRYGIYGIVRRHAKVISMTLKSVQNKHIGPHTIRHTTATHLLRAGVDINTIRGWLGHVSIDTTNIYAEIDLEAKAEILEQCEHFQPRAAKKKRWKDDHTLMHFLRAL